MSRGKIASLVVLVLLIVAVLYARHATRHGFTAREQPSAFETLVARAARNMAIPRDARDEENPWKGLDTPDNLKEAREHFADHCSSCHGNDGSGNTEMGKNMYPKPPDLRLPATQNLTDGELYWIIENGVRLTGMPAWGDPQFEIQDDDSWKLVLFIRHMPHLTAEDMQDMQSYNPKGKMEEEDEEEENAAHGDHADHGDKKDDMKHMDMQHMNMQDMQHMNHSQPQQQK
jgi:mono/diheme cytochrome c family protein